jgi:cell division protease FtsH
VPSTDPIHKATIIPRGRALGLVQRLPEQDRYSQSREYLESSLAILFGGRVAEELIFGHNKVTTGASSDIKMATELARRMVTEWGMSDKLGPLRFDDNEQEVFLGHSVTQRKNVSDATAEVIDEEIRSLIDTANAKARKILGEKLDDLHKLAKGLLEYETLGGEEIKALLRGEPIVRNDASDADQSGPTAASPFPAAGSRDVPGRKGGLDPSPQPGS